MYFFALAIYIVTVGVPSDTSQVALWAMIALICAAMVHPDHRIARVLFDWLPFIVVLFAFDWSRGIAVRVGVPVHTRRPAEIDKMLFGGTVPTVWLQRHLDIADGTTHPWEAATSLVYVTHFFASVALAVVLWLRDRARWLRYIRRLVTLMATGIAIYIAVPWMPPWLASKDGYLPELHRASDDGWKYLHMSRAGALLSVGQAGVNLNAAMPSLHLAFAALISMFLWGRARPIVRAALVAYPIAMGSTW